METKFLPWSAALGDPITIDGDPLVTLSDAAQYLMAVAPSDRRSREWLEAVESVLLAAERAGPMEDAKVDMLRLVKLLGHKKLQKVESPAP
jgi:hypothetical protein